MSIVYGYTTHDIQSREVYNATFAYDLVLKKQTEVTINSNIESASK